MLFMTFVKRIRLAPVPASVPIPKFASPHISIDPQANFGIEGRWQLIDFWCRFGFEVRSQLDIKTAANLETTTPGALHEFLR